MRKSGKLNGISLGDMRSVPFVLILGVLWKPVTGDLYKFLITYSQKLFLRLSVVRGNGNFCQNI